MVSERFASNVLYPAAVWRGPRLLLPPRRCVRPEMRLASSPWRARELSRVIPQLTGSRHCLPSCAARTPKEDTGVAMGDGLDCPELLAARLRAARAQ